MINDSELVCEFSCELPANKVDVLFFAPLRATALFPVKVVEPFGAALFLWARADKLSHRCPRDSLSNNVPRLCARQLMDHLCQPSLLFLRPFS